MKTKVMFISSEGGHLDELRQLEFNKYDYSLVTEKTETTEKSKKAKKTKGETA